MTNDLPTGPEPTASAKMRSAVVTLKPFPGTLAATSFDCLAVIDGEWLHTMTTAVEASYPASEVVSVWWK